jgi:hypothetical protein
MKSNSLPNSSRRSFLTTSTFAAAGLAAAGVGAKSVFAKPVGFTNGMQINPDIDNLRVVACRNPAMENSSPLKWDSLSQNKVVNTAQVSDTMDKMACALAMQADAQTAWATILRKPDAKSWQNVIAAIKVNCSGLDATTGIHPRAAIIDKVCRVLNGFGVPFPNITIYDTVDDVMANFNGFRGTYLPSNVIVSNGGDTYAITVMNEPLKCTTIIQNADILVNIAVNKPHIATWVGFTMTLKNHVGTITRSTHGQNCPKSLTQLFEHNKHEAIIGNPAAGVPCKQQLCIIDSLWSSDVGDWSAIPNTAPYYLVMGTFGPAVDYLTARKIRIDMMQCTTHPDNLLNQFITYFGYTDTERQNLTALTPDQNGGRGWVEVPMTKVVDGEAARRWPEAETCELVVENRRVLQFSFPASERIVNATICTADGRLVCNLRRLSERRFAWDMGFANGARAAHLWHYLHVTGTRCSRSFHLSPM